MSSVISVIITAFVTGALARFAVPGPDPMPAWLTILIGLVGTLIGAGVVYAIAGADPAWMGIAGFLCAIVLVLVYRRFVQKRAIWGPEAYRFPQRGAPAQTGADDPTENPAHYLRLLDELHDNGVLESDEYQTARTRLLERLRA